MPACKKYVTIKDPAKLELTDLPFRAGQRVEVMVIAEEIEEYRAGRDDMEWIVSSELMTETPLNDHSFCYSIPKAGLRKIRNRLIRKDPGV